MSDEPLHQSTIKSYLWCGQSFKYRYVNGMLPAFRNAAAVHGTVIHRLIEKLHQGNWDMDVKKLYPEMLEYEEQHGQDSEIPIFWKGNKEKVVGKLCNEAAEIIQGYRNKEYNRKTSVVLSEATFMLKLGRNIYSGTIDQLRDNGDGTFTLVDLKTSQFQPDQSFLDVDYQFGLYAYAVWQGVFKLSDGSMKILGIPPEKLNIMWYHLRDHIPYKRATNGNKVGDEKGDPRRWTSRTKAQLATVKRDLTNTASAIKRGVFVRNPDQQRCGWCAYSDICVEDSKGSALNMKQIQQVKSLTGGVYA